MGESHLMWHHFPRVDHLKIESQRLDLKPIYNKTTPAEKEIRARRKKKKKTKKKKRRRKKPRLAWPGSRGLGHPSPRSHGLGGLARSLSLPLWSDSFSLSYLVSLSLIWLSLSFWIINRVLKTRFSSSCHMENNATSDVIRSWKSSLK